MVFPSWIFIVNILINSENNTYITSFITPTITTPLSSLSWCTIWWRWWSLSHVTWRAVRCTWFTITISTTRSTITWTWSSTRSTSVVSWSLAISTTWWTVWRTRFVSITSRGTAKSTWRSSLAWSSIRSTRWFLASRA